MIITVFYDRRDFFGAWDYNVEEHAQVFDGEALSERTKKCFSSFGRVRNFAFRVEDGKMYGESYLVERKPGDAEAGVFTVTHIYGGINNDSPVKMSGTATHKLIREFFKKTIEAEKSA